MGNHQGTAQTLAAKPGEIGHNSPFLFLFHTLFHSLPLLVLPIVSNTPFLLPTHLFTTPGLTTSTKLTPQTCTEASVVGGVHCPPLVSSYSSPGKTPALLTLVLIRPNPPAPTIHTPTQNLEGVHLLIAVLPQRPENRASVPSCL